jgi:fructose-1,6-bisphosphatase/sedoheptulose 1,7-bisphosphatase-like protein
MSARFEPQNPAQAQRLANWPGLDPARIYALEDLVKGDAVFAIGSVTGSLGLAPPQPGKRFTVVTGMVVSTRSKAAQPRRFSHEVDAQQDR